MMWVKNAIKLVLFLMMSYAFVKTLAWQSWPCVTIDTHNFRQLVRYYAGMEELIEDRAETCPMMKPAPPYHHWSDYFGKTMFPHKLVGFAGKILNTDPAFLLGLFTYSLLVMNLITMYYTTKLITGKEIISLFNSLLLIMHPLTYFIFHFGALVNQLFIQTIIFITIYLALKLFYSDNYTNSQKVKITAMLFISLLFTLMYLKKPWQQEWFHPLEWNIDVLRYFFTAKYLLIVGMTILIQEWQYIKYYFERIFRPQLFE